MSITTEHLLLGLLREDKGLMRQFISETSLDSIRAEIEGRIDVRDKVPTSIDLPLSEASKRVLAYADEESRRFQNKNIGAEHILLGILREKTCIAADVLNERGVSLEDVREELSRAPSPPPSRGFPIADEISQRLGNHAFGEALKAFSKAAEAGNQRDWLTAHQQLTLFFEHLVAEIMNRPEDDGTLFEDFDWATAQRSVRSGLSDAEEWDFRWRLTILLADVLLKRYEQRL